MATPLHCVYVDLDGTLLGRDGSLLHDGDGAFSLLGVRALEACARAGAEVVLFSGRRRANVENPSRLIGQRSYIYEAGAVLVLDGEPEYLTGGLVPVDGRTIHDQIADSGAPALLLDAFKRRLEYHTPWHTARQFSHLFRGEVDLGAVEALLREHGHQRLRLVDNGLTRRRSPTLEVDTIHTYHLIPRAAGKANAVAAHMRRRGFDRSECIAIGDSRGDLEVAGTVGRFFLVANAIHRDPDIMMAAGSSGGVTVTEEPMSGGFYEAVVRSLAEG